MLNQILPSLTIGQPATLGRLSVFPLFGTVSAHQDMMLLDEALDAGAIEISEVSESGSVPELLLRSLGDKPVLLVDGEELVGAKQNRILNTSVLAAPHSEIRLPVSCVEQGRWGYKSRAFGKSDKALFAMARAKKAARMASRPMAPEWAAQSRKFDADQSAVWGDISDKFARLQLHSPSMAMHDGYDSMQHRLEEFETLCKPTQGQIGAAFALDGKVVGVELLGAAAAFPKLFRKLLQSYAFDAIENGTEDDAAAPATISDVEAFLHRVGAAPLLTQSSVSLGEDVRIDGDACVGHALIHEGALIHLAAFDQALAV